MKYQYFAIDALPQAVQETFDDLRDELSAWLTPENASTWGDFEVILEFESKLAALKPVAQIRYLASLLTAEGKEIYLAAGGLLSTDFYNFYFSWLAVRLTEALGAYVGNNLLRSNQERLEARWEQARHHKLLFRISNRKADELLHFLFTTLIPQARALVGREPAVTVGEVAKQFTHESQQPPVARPRGHTPTALPQTLETLCCNSFTPQDVRKLLTELGVLDENTGRWHLGNLTTRAAGPKSAFPAAYRALAEARLLLQTDAPIYRKIFEKEFGAVIGDRTANYKEGSGSNAFHDYLGRARYWVKVWKTKL